MIQIRPQRVWTEEPTPRRRERLWIREGKKCHWCGRATRLVAEEAADQATIDHILPRYKGGMSEDTNLVSACRGCNGRRNSEDMKGLPEGSLLGKHQEMAGKPRPHHKKKERVALTGDEKRAILHPIDVDLSLGTPILAGLPAKPGHRSEIEMMRLQRDQALGAVLELRTELKRREEAAAALERKLKAMTVGRLIRQRLAEWLTGA